MGKDEPPERDEQVNRYKPLDGNESAELSESLNKNKPLDRDEALGRDETADRAEPVDRYEQLVVVPRRPSHPPPGYSGPPLEEAELPDSDDILPVYYGSRDSPAYISSVTSSPSLKG